MTTIYKSAQSLRILLLLFSMTAFVNGFGQRISTIISKDKILIGEQITVKLRLEDVSRSVIIKDFTIPDTINHLEILSHTEEVINNTIIHDLIITSFDSGYWELPAFEVELSGNRKLRSEVIGITVLAVDVSTLQDYHDIKNIIEVQPENNWYVIAAIVLIALIALFSLLWFINRHSVEPVAMVPSASIEDAYKKAMASLEQLKTGYATREPAAVFGGLTALVRNFVDTARQTSTGHQTTGEYLIYHKGHLPDAGTETDLFQLLRMSDAVRFARYQPPSSETDNAFVKVSHIIAQVYQKAKKSN